MKTNLSLCALAAASSLLLACNATPDTHDADIKALTDNEVQWNQDFASKDVAKIVAHYADDGVLMVTGEKPTVGRAALQAAFTGMTSDPAFALTIHTQKAEVAKSGDLGYTQGSYTLDITDPATKQVAHDHGSYVTVYRKSADGSWKATEDVPTSEIPPTPPPSK